MKLSRNFSLEEFTKSQTAIRLGIDNTPSDEEIAALIALCDNVLQPVREYFGITTINSGYRGNVLNRRIGGARKSQHKYGQAADIEVPGVSNYDLANWIKENLEFDQLILEFYTPGVLDSGWVHVSWQNERVNRNTVLTAIKQHRRTVYKVGLVK